MLLMGLVGPLIARFVFGTARSPNLRWALFFALFFGLSIGLFILFYYRYGLPRKLLERRQGEDE